MQHNENNMSHEYKLFLHKTQVIMYTSTIYVTKLMFMRWVKTLLYSGMRFGFSKNSANFYVAIDSNPIQHHRFQLPKMSI